MLPFLPLRKCKTARINSCMLNWFINKKNNLITGDNSVESHVSKPATASSNKAGSHFVQRYHGVIPNSLFLLTTETVLRTAVVKPKSMAFNRSVQLSTDKQTIKCGG